MPQQDPTPLPKAGDPLESWKEIAEYLDRGVTTVRRWEREEGLPVRRHEHQKRGSVIAYREEIDAWRARRVTPLDEDVRVPAEPISAVAVEPPRRRGLRLALMGGLATLTGAAGWAWMRQPQPPRELRSIRIASDLFPNEFPSLSPDGRQVVYSRRGAPDGGLVIKSVDAPGDAGRRLTRHGDDLVPRWSPDGRWILFSRMAGDTLDVMLVAAEGGEPELVQRRQRHVLGMQVEWASWMPDGRGVLFADREGAGQPLAMYILTLQTRRVRQITFPRSGYGDVAAAASPDGRHVVFVRYQGGGESDLHLVPAAGGAETRLTRDRCLHFGLAWDSAGEHIVYSSNRAAASERSLWRIPMTSGGVPGAPQLVTPTLASGARFPSVRSYRGGSRIAYTSLRQTFNVLQCTAGGEPSPISPSSEVDAAAEFSPDGARVVFCSNRSGKREIWIAGAGTGTAQQVTRLTEPYPDSPRWSPNGRQIVFSLQAHDNRDIYVIDAAGTGLRRLTTEPGENGRPCWSPDGRWIYFRSNRSGIRQIWKIPAGGNGPATPVTEGGGFEPLADPSGRWIYYSKDRDEPGLWRVPVNGGEEEKVLDGVREGHWSLTRAGVYFVCPDQPKVKAQLWHWPFDGAATELMHPDLGDPAELKTGFSMRHDGRVWLIGKSTTRSAIVVLDGV
jgi:Tol biopolymer transport system component